MNNFKIRISKNLKNKNKIIEICKLKNEAWEYGIKNQLKWFKKKVKKKDIHIMIEIKKKIIGYVLLRERKYYLKSNKNVNGKFYYFDSFIIKKKFRKKGFGQKLIDIANKIILKKKYFSVLTSRAKNINFYKKNKWKLSKRITLLDHHNRLNTLTFNLKGLKYLQLQIN